MQKSEPDSRTTEPGSGVDTLSSQEENAPEQKNDEQPRLTGLPLYALLISMLLLIFIVILDISIVSTAIPRITDEFHTIADIGWYGSAYLISQCSVQPLSGRIFSFFPFKASFLIFFGVFELGSLICGVAQSSKMLVVGRAICGIGSAGLTNAILTIIGVASPPGKKAMYMGILMSISSCGQIIGPLIGGALTEHVSWRWCFYINLPVGALTSFGFLFTPFPDVRDKKADRSIKSIFMGIDIPGFLQFAPSCVMLLLALEWGGTKYAWKSATIIGLLCGAVVLFVIFALWERRHGDLAMIPPSLVGNRAVFSSCITSLFNGSGMIILSYYLPIYFQATKNASPTSSGVYMLPSFISQVLLSITTGGSMRKIGYALLPLLLGSALVSTSYGLLSTLKINSGAGEWIGYQIIAGAGRGMALQMPILVVQSSVAKPKISTGTAMVLWSQFFGMALFLSVAQTVFVHVLKTALHEYAPSLDATVVSNAGATGFASVVPPEYHKAVERAYAKGVANTFYLGLALSLGAFISSFGTGTLKVDMAQLKDGVKPKGDAAKDTKTEEDAGQEGNSSMSS
ncbi:hypothetical protein DV736_g5441, partial [Chaetothyriales sp. CBS 134916]